MKVRAGVSGQDKPVSRKPQTPRARQHTSAHSASRIPMSEQLRGLAPEGAVGYRLVMPTRTPDDMPRLSPPLDATGYQGHYSLCPFQVPYDIRLMDGQIYRVVWTGSSGEIISPKTDGTIPGLHFFLTSSASPIRTEAESTSNDSVLTTGTESLKTEGSPSSRQTEVDAQRDVTPIPDSNQLAHYLTLTERLTEALAAAMSTLGELRACLAAHRQLAVLESGPANGMANGRGTAQKETTGADLTLKVGEVIAAKEPLYQQHGEPQTTSAQPPAELSGPPSLSAVETDKAAEQQAPHELAAQESSSPSESITPPQSVTASESTQQSETPGDEIGVPPLQATSAEATADPPSQTEIVASWDHHAMSAEEKQLVIRVALNEDKMTVLCRELRIGSHVGDSSDPPIDSTYVPKAEDVRELASIAGKPVILMAVSELYQALSRAPLAKPSGEYQQPRRIPSLSDFEKQRVRTAFRSSEQRAHFEYLMSRRDAIRLRREEPPPPKSTSGFNREARRKLEQFFRDTRTSALMNALLKQEWEPGKMTERKESFLPLSALSFLPSGI